MKTNKRRKGTLRVNNTYEAEPREDILRKVMAGETQDIENGVFPIIYTEKSNGIMPEYDIRTDRFEVALDAMDKVSQANLSEYTKSKQNNEENIVKANKDLPKEDNNPIAGES